RAGGNGIHADALFGEAAGEGPGKGDDGALGGRVVDQGGRAAIGGDRSGVDDGSALVEVRQGSLGHVEIAEQIGLEGLGQLFGGDVGEVLLDVLLGGVVDEDIELAELFDDLADHVVAEGLVGDVAADQ